MTLEISINCDNAAFEDDPGEVSRILRDLADRMQDSATADHDETPLLDANGNRVGVVIVRK